jgi:TrmH family RNA methyltransferase
LALEGRHLLGEALAAGLIPEVVFYAGGSLAEVAGGRVAALLPPETKQVSIAPALFKRLAGTETPQGVAAVVRYREKSIGHILRQELNLALFLDRIQDPGNLGTIIRTAAAAQAGAVFLSPGCADPYSPKVLRSTAGAVFHIDLAEVPDPLTAIKQLQESKCQVIAAHPGAKAHYWEPDYSRPTALLIGNESGGLDPGLLAAADMAVSILQPGLPASLNAAVAAGIILFEILKQRYRE